MPRDVFVSSVGIVSPAGGDAEHTWASLLAGDLAVRPVVGVDLAGCRTTFGGQIRGFRPPPEAQGLSRAGQLVITAAIEAMTSAGLAPGEFGGTDPSRVRVCLGTSKPALEFFASYNRKFPKPDNTTKDCVFPNHPFGGFDGLIPEERSRAYGNLNTLADSLADAPARLVASWFAVRGGVHTSVAACASGTHAVIQAARSIAAGEADLVLCGGTEASLQRLWMAAYEQMGVLAGEHPSRGPAWACRPFDRTRDGFAVGEGAAILVLESDRSVERRGHRPVARIAGWATGTDPAGLTQLTPDGTLLAHVIQLACARARCEPGNLACVHAHGTGTPANDLVETRAIRRSLGRLAEAVPIVSIKGAIGHLMGSAGAVETAVAVLSCRDRRCPGTATLLDPDPQLGRLSLPRDAFELEAGAVLKTSLGFGGHLAAIVVTGV